MRYFSTFSGIGGFELGINNAYEALYNANRDSDRIGSIQEEANPEERGERLQQSQGQDNGSEKRSVSSSPSSIWFNERPFCVGYSEIDKFASQVYSRHFPEHQNYGDITKIDPNNLPEFDVLVGGFPCQSFSIAGRREGFLDQTRGTLFFELARIIKCKRPAYFVFENVKGLLNHDGGRTFGTIISTLDELGYDLQWQVLNSKNFRVPQNRERVYIVGHLRGKPRPEIFPIFGSSESNLGKNYSAIAYHNSRRVSNTSKTVNTLTATFSGSPDADGRPAIMDSRNSLLIRKLTPLECERLQAFPDNWTEGMSKTQRYKMCGNAVTVNVVEAVFRSLLK